MVDDGYHLSKYRNLLRNPPAMSSAMETRQALGSASAGRQRVVLRAIASPDEHGGYLG